MIGKSGIIVSAGVSKADGFKVFSSCLFLPATRDAALSYFPPTGPCSNSIFIVCVCVHAFVCMCVRAHVCMGAFVLEVMASYSMLIHLTKNLI